MFYLQRSHIAWCYGQGTLVLCGRSDLAAALDEADSWLFWLRYRLAFVAIGLAAAELFLAVLVKTEVLRLGSGACAWLAALVLVILAFAAAWSQYSMVRNRDRKQPDG